MAPPIPSRIDQLLDHARALWVTRGQDGLTLVALSERSGVSVTAVRTTFGSRPALLARTWLRDANRLHRAQAEAVDKVAVKADPRERVVAAALVYVDHALRHENAVRLLLLADVADLASPALGGLLAQELAAMKHRRGRLIVTLADALWGRRDVGVCTVVQYCIEDLPRTVLAGDTLTTDSARSNLEAEVRRIVDVVMTSRGARPR